VKTERHHELLPGLTLAAERALESLNESRIALGMLPATIHIPGLQRGVTHDRAARQIERRNRNEARKARAEGDRQEKLLTALEKKYKIRG
jgi:hypothetical protein